VNTSPHPTNPTPLRPPYEFVVGLDFGTAFTKCVVRDDASGNAFIVKLGNPEYWRSSEIKVCGSGFVATVETATERTRLPFLKMALAAAAKRDSTNPSLRRLEAIAFKSGMGGSVDHFLDAAVVCLLADVLHQALNFIKSHRKDFGQNAGDTWSVNMAVPVAHSDETIIRSRFGNCLCKARALVENGMPAELGVMQLAETVRNLTVDPKTSKLCSTYPEVSANVISFIESRAFSEGLYIFVDVGAGTVDVSVFIYSGNLGVPLNYFGAKVLSYGSSRLELRASGRLRRKVAAILGLANANVPSDQKLAEVLEAVFREYKETGAKGGFKQIEEEFAPVEAKLRKDVFDNLGFLAQARSHVQPHHVNPHHAPTARQWRGLRMLFGGGAGSSELYKAAFDDYFNQCWRFSPEKLPLQRPRKLQRPSELAEKHFEKIIPRFTVAYGLSVHVTNLPPNRLPGDIAPAPPPDEDDYPPHLAAPTKDEC
jgi:hypothetical protein